MNEIEYAGISLPMDAIGQKSIVFVIAGLIARKINILTAIITLSV
jgi:hypothetical protein